MVEVVGIGSPSAGASGPQLERGTGTAMLPIDALHILNSRHESRRPGPEHAGPRWKALVEEASVTRAAARIGLSQPAMSHALKRLRALHRRPAAGAQRGPHAAGRGGRTRSASPCATRLARVRACSPTERFRSRHQPADLPVPGRGRQRVRPAAAAAARTAAPAGPGIRIELRPLLAGDDAFATAQALDVAVACVPAVFPASIARGSSATVTCGALRRGHPLARGAARGARGSSRPSTWRWRRSGTRTRSTCLAARVRECDAAWC
jgi:hypothetical protein